MARISRKHIDLHKVTLYAIVANGLQILFALSVALLSIFGRNSVMTGRIEQVALGTMALIVVWGAVVDIREAFAARRIGEESDMLEDAYDQLNELNGTLRKQRHDFMNHLQVVYSLLELDEQKDAREYIEQVYGDIQKVGRTLKTAIPAVNALLAAKLHDCDERGIVTSLDIRSAWDDVPVTDWELCRVLGNLLDNAMDAVKDAQNPCIRIFMGEDIREYTFTVSNNGPEIPEALRVKIFQQGFTTKITGNGMGLAIVREILSAYGGAISVMSDETQTAFTGAIPKSGEKSA